MNKHHAPPHEDPLETAAADIQDWLPVKAFCERFPNIPQKTLNWQLTCRAKNGLAPYVQVIGKQRFISVRGYAQWLQANTGSADNTKRHPRQ